MAATLPIEEARVPHQLRTITGKRLVALVEERTGDPELTEMVRVISQVLPFKVSSYVIDELIDWTDAENDAIFRLTFPQRGMLTDAHFDQVQQALNTGDKETLKSAVSAVRHDLNPHPSGQLAHNVPVVDELEMWGLQHKYRETMLVFPRQGQTCHSYCGYCFRWAQFVDEPDLKQAVSGSDVMVKYLAEHPEISDVLLTGGDPMVMRTDLVASYVEPLIHTDSIDTIRIGTKAVAYWPYRFTEGAEAQNLLNLLARAVDSGKHVAMMLHFTHPRELETDAAREALQRISETGAVMRAQAPLVRHINDDPQLWADMWREEVRQKVVPYYMFVERDTGARGYFGLPLARAYQIYSDAVRQVSGLARHARGPVMSAAPGKVAVDGIVDLHEGKAFALRFLQHRDPSRVGQPFFAKFDDQAEWWDALRPLRDADAPFFTMQNLD